jgi:hypothetical protein
VGGVRPPVVVAVALAAAVAVLAATQGGPDHFLQLGERSHNLSLAREVLGDDVAVPLEDGHDGESSWVLARDPLLLDDAAADRFDRPVYRAQRIGYPLLAAPWRLGGEQALLWGLVVTNVVAIVVGSWAAGRLGHPLAAYAFAFNPLVILALLFDFADAMALAGVVLALLAAARGRAGSAAAASIGAALAKEPSLLALGAAAVLTRNLSARLRIALVVPGAAAAGAWRLYVMSRPGFGTDPQVQELEAVPFRGFVDAWDRSWGPGDHWFDAAVAVALVGVAVAAVVVWWRRRDVASSAALGPCALLPFLSAQVVALPTNSLRAAGAAITLLGIGVTRRPVA